jgi:hypothetical protein
LDVHSAQLSFTFSLYIYEPNLVLEVFEYV